MMRDVVMWYIPSFFIIEMLKTVELLKVFDPTVHSLEYFRMI